MTIAVDPALPPHADDAHSAVAPLDVPAGRRPHLWTRARSIGLPPRVMGLDVARGLAIAGMVAAHMASAPEVEWGDPTTWAGLVHGRSAVLFALLAGVSTALITGRTSRPTKDELPAMRSRLVRRGIAIFVIGLVLELLNTNIAIILCVYGVLFLCAVPVLRWRVRSLVIGAVVMALVAPLLLASVQTLAFGPYGPGVSLALFGVYPVPVWLAFMLAGLAVGRTRFTMAKTAAVILGLGVVISAVGYTAGAIAARHLEAGAGASASGAGSGMDDVTSGGSAVGDDGGSGFTTIPGSDLAGSLDALSADGMTCDVSPAQWINCYRPTDTGSAPVEEEDQGYWDRLTSGTPVRDVLTAALAVSEHSGGTPEILGSGGFALAVLGLCLLLARPLKWLLLPVACLGMMPLTTYSAHVVVYLVLEGGPGGYFDPSWAIWGWTAGGLALFAVLWTVLFGRGPLERLLARVARVPRDAPDVSSGEAVVAGGGPAAG